MRQLGPKGRSLTPIFTLLTAAGFLTIGACKQTDDAPKAKPSKLSVHLEHDADSTQETSGVGKFFTMLWNQPYATRLDDLPPSGTVPSAKMPYSGSWWPMVSGGTGRRLDPNQYSALEKYDQAFHSGQTLASDWEAKNHTVTQDNPNAGWSGHCNGWSASAQRHSEPKHSVTINGVTFTTWDIKAMLAEINMSAKFFYLGGNRCQDTSPLRRPSDRLAAGSPTVLNACDDVNAGSFHLALTNVVGRMQHTVIMDLKPDTQVWNYPVYSYTSSVKSVDASEAYQKIMGTQAQGSATVFNPAATRFASVATTITYADDFADESMGYPTLTAKPVSYTYILEMNDNNEIIGGEWTGDSQTTHPDFVWVAMEPFQNTADTNYGNPYLDVNQVIKIWAHSVDADPNHPPLDVMEPSWLSTWGKFNNFEITLDGGNRGVVFLGKHAHLTISRKNALVSASSVDVLLNTATIATLQGGSDGASLNLDFDPPAGLNLLSFIWKQNGTQVDSGYVRFHAVP